MVIAFQVGSLGDGVAVGAAWPVAFLLARLLACLARLVRGRAGGCQVRRSVRVVDWAAASVLMKLSKKSARSSLPPSLSPAHHRFRTRMKKARPGRSQNERFHRCFLRFLQVGATGLEPATS
jgi:hypothetical protein